MSYYANEVEDDIMIAPKSPTNRRGSTRRSGSKRRSSSKKSSRRSLTSDDEGDVVEDDIVLVGTNNDDGEERAQEEKRRSSKSRERKAKLRAKGEGSSRMMFAKKKGRKSRQKQVYDDLYGTDYQEVDDGIVGCADGLCVGGAGVLEDGIDLNTAENDNSTSLANSSKRSALLSSTAGSKTLKGMSISPNTGEQNKVDENEEVYVVRQRYGYFSIFFGVIQIIILALMMWQCGIAPMNINPMFGPYPDALSEWGGKNSILIVEDGEWWRLMTPILLHAGVIHLVCNVAVQLELGVFFEREWGSMTWLIIYFTSALGSSVLSVITMPDAVSVGSSGAVMGLFGGKLAEVICRSCEKQDTAQDRVAHQVRKEQCLGVTCSVVVVMAFSFIPYGTSIVSFWHCTCFDSSCTFFSVYRMNQHSHLVSLVAMNNS